MGAVRQEIRYQRVGESPEEGEEEVTLHIYSDPPSVDTRRHYQETCCRILSSVLLLAVAAGFALYDLHSAEVTPPLTQQRFLVLHVKPDHNLSEGSPPPLSSHGDTEDHHHHHQDQEEEEEEEEEDSPSHHHSAGTYHHAAAVTHSATCSMVARDILQSGGSVVDASIAAVFCLVVVHPHTCSFGGVFSSILLESSSQNVSVVNGIPEEASPVQYGLPQILQGLWLLHDKHGKTPWSQLVSPAAILAVQGFLVDSSLAAALVSHRDKVLSSTGLCSLFCKPDGSLLGVGEQVKNQPLGRLLEQISRVDSSISDDIMDSLVNDTNVSEKEKFARAISRNKPTVEDPVTLQLEGQKLYTTGGPTAGQILSSSIHKIYEEIKRRGPTSASEILLNASKMMYAEGGAWPSELSSSFFSPPPSRSWAPVGSDVIVADSQGNMFVLSLTLNSTFGSGLVVPSKGILLSDFVNGQGSTLRFWACPSVLVSEEGDRVTGLSASGGSSVPFSLAQVIMGQLLLDKDLSESLTASLVKAPPQSSNPWLGYFGVQGKGTDCVVAVEVAAEHVHVGKSPEACSYHEGL